MRWITITGEGVGLFVGDRADIGRDTRRGFLIDFGNFADQKCIRFAIVQ